MNTKGRIEKLEQQIEAGSTTQHPGYISIDQATAWQLEEATEEERRGILAAHGVPDGVRPKIYCGFDPDIDW